MKRHDPAPCEGARGTTPEAALCRCCARVDVICDPDVTRFVVPAVKLDATALGRRYSCPLFVRRKG